MKSHADLIASHKRDVTPSRCKICFDNSTKMERIKFDDIKLHGDLRGKVITICIDCIAELKDWSADTWTLL